MRPQVAFFVQGIPRPQGSKRAIVNRHTGKPALIESSRHVKDWRGDVRRAALDAWGRNRLMAGPVRMVLLFRFIRPLAHYIANKRDGRLRPSAPREMTGPPDLSKLQRAIEDALEGIVYANDKQIWSVVAEKVYVAPNETPGAYISLWSKG